MADQPNQADSEKFAEDPGYEPSEELMSEPLEDADIETSLSEPHTGSLSEEDVQLLEGAEQDLAAERLADLQRVSAEFANYRKRVEASREVERERAVADTVRALLPILDDVDRAEKHGDLVDGSSFATIASKLRAVTERLGLTAYGEAGEDFDPNLHEAIVQQPTADVSSEIILEVAERGYMMGGTQVRPAKVIVAVPA